MQIFLIVLCIVGTLIALPLILAMLVKKDYVIERSIVIEAPAEKVFQYVKLLKNQDAYSKWVMTDPQMKKTFRGVDGTLGFVYGWNGNKKAGEGEQEITNIIENQRIDTEVRFKRPFENTGYIYMILELVTNGGTKVRWGMKGTTAYPMNIINAALSKMLAKDLDISLHNLKCILESSSSKKQSETFATSRV